MFITSFDLKYKLSTGNVKEHDDYPHLGQNWFPDNKH
jgi:hypothetical protein